MAERYFFHVWTDGCAVFDRQTGDTHVLDPLAASLLLKALGAEPETIARLGSVFDSTDAVLNACYRLAELALPGALAE